MKTIEEIVLKKLRNELDNEEEKAFANWICDSEENKVLYQRLLELVHEGSDAHKISMLDIDRAWKNVRTRVRSRRRIPLRRKRWAYYAAASVLLLVAISLFRTMDDTEKVRLAPPVILNSRIETGTDKAILTLSSGEEVALDKGNAFQGINASSNGEQLVYDRGTKKEITYNVLTVPRGGQFKIVLSDGTEVWLNSESRLRYPVAFDEMAVREVELTYGEAYFDVSSSIEHKGAKFKVIHSGQEVEVLGTEFNIKAYKDETNVYTTLVEGEVKVKSNGVEITSSLLPGQQSNLDIMGNTMMVEEVDVYNEVSWKDGVFSFDNKSLQAIMKVLSRWYDMEVHFEDEALEKVVFVGKLKKSQSIEEILDAIKGASIIDNYNITDKLITLK